MYKTTANSRLPQWGLTWLNQVQCFYQHLCLVDSEVLRNPHCGKRQNVGGNYNKTYRKENVFRNTNETEPNIVEIGINLNRFFNKFRKPTIIKINISNG